MTSRRSLLIPWLLVLWTSLPAPPARAQPERDGSKALLREISSTTLRENLRVLCDEIGGRLPGTPSMNRAVDWAVEAFERAGAERVHTESFTVPNSWREGATRIEVVEPVRFRVRGVSSAWVPATPPGGIEAEVIDGGIGSVGHIRRMRNKARGKIVLLRSRLVSTFEELAVEQRNSTVAVREAAEVGAAAVVFMSTRPNGLLYRHINIINGELDKIPTALLAREDAQRIHRLIEAGRKVRLRLSLPNETGGPFEARNVVAEIPGSDLADEQVILGGHLDSWDLGSGCLDNGCNVALIVEAARAIQASGARPRRTIRFVLFGAEEQGLHGSRAYVRAHRDELDSVSAVVVHDMGAGKIKGYSLGGRGKLKARVERIMAPIFDRGANAHDIGAFFGSDHFDFLLEGVPTLVALQDTSEYVATYHSSADTFDKVNLGRLRDQVEIAAVTVLGLANAPEKLGERLSRRQVQRLLEDTRLDEQLKFLNMWDDWRKGRRGRAKND